MLRTITPTRRTVVLATSVIFCGVLFLGGVAVSSAQGGFGASKGLPSIIRLPIFTFKRLMVQP